MELYKVIGPPGCGKTTWLARQVQLAVDKGQNPVVLSLTRAAAKEAAGRTTAIPAENVGTIHAFAYRALGHPEIADTNKNIGDWNRKHPHFKLSAIDDKTSRTDADKSIRSDFEIDRANMRVSTPESHAARFGEKWTTWKRQNELVDFTDLLEECLANVDEAPGSPDAIFIDEAQDLSKLELELLMKWGASAGRLILVGDPWQNLYEWRGTSPDIMGNQPNIVLNQSYRVPADVHARATEWIKGMEDYSPIVYKPRDARGEVNEIQANWIYPTKVVNEIKDDLANGMTVMIIGQAGYMLEPTYNIFRDEAVLFHNPFQENNGAWNPLGKRRGTSASDKVRAFLRFDQDLTSSISELIIWTKAVYANAVLAKGIRYKDFEDVEVDENDHVSDTDITRLLSPEAADAFYWGDLNWLSDNLKVASQSMRYPIKLAKKHGAQILNQIPRCVVGTIHSVKGAEADSVYVYPDISPAANEAFQNSQSRGAKHRLGYVAMTRAREKLSIINPVNSKMAMQL